MRITLQIEDFIRGIIVIWHTCPYRSAKVMTISTAKIAVDTVGKLQHASVEYVTS